MTTHVPTSGPAPSPAFDAGHWLSRYYAAGGEFHEWTPGQPMFYMHADHFDTAGPILCELDKIDGARAAVRALLRPETAQ